MTPAAFEQPSEILAANPHVCISRAAGIARFSLRARGDLSGHETALRLALPIEIGARTGQGGRSALRLGPDEWVLQTDPDDAPALVAAFDGLYDTCPHSLVDVSGREATLVIEGPRVMDLLCVGMARDPETIEPGEARRLNFDGVTVVLWRDAPDRVRMDVWHSFVPHILGLLETAQREFAA